MIENFISNNANHLETLLASNTVYNHVAVNANEMLAVQNRVFILVIVSYEALHWEPQTRTWPAVSIISTAKSWFLYLITLEKVFSIVG